MKESDAAGIRRSFTDSAILQSIATNKEGKTIATSESVEAFATVISHLAKGDADERIRFDVVKPGAASEGALSAFSAGISY